MDDIEDYPAPVSRRKKPRHVEAPIQRAIVQYLCAVLPDAIVHHAKNEINKSGQSIRMELHRAKMSGAVPGWPDLIVLMPFHVGPLFFEVKSPTGSLSSSQRDMHKSLRDLGYRVAVVRSVDDVRATLALWGIWVREVSR